MRLWRVALVAGVVGLAGFVGGVWFVSSDWAFRLIRLPSVPPATSGPTAGARGSAGPGLAGAPGPRPPIKPKVEAVDVPAIWNIMSGGTGLGFVADRADLLPAAGCSWEVEPREFRPGNHWQRTNVERILLGVPALDPATRRLTFLLTQWTRARQEVRTLRVVLFDAAGNRYEGRSQGDSISSRDHEALQTSRFDWDETPPLDDPSSVYFAVERVPPNAQKLAADAARAEAKAKKVDLLPPPRIGEPFPFDLATVDGGRARAADLKGRAVLIAITGPFPRGPLSLKNLRKEFPPADLAVVNVSFDGDVEAARRTRDQLGEPAPLVLVPNDLPTRRLWREGAEVSALPAYWLVDRAGILRFECRAFDLDDRLATTLGRLTWRGQHDARHNAAVIEARRKLPAQAKAPSGNPTPSSPSPKPGKP